MSHGRRQIPPTIKDDPPATCSFPSSFVGRAWAWDLRSASQRHSPSGFLNRELVKSRDRKKSTVSLVTLREFRVWGSNRMVAAAEDGAQGNNISGGDHLFSHLGATALVSLA